MQHRHFCLRDFCFLNSSWLKQNSSLPSPPIHLPPHPYLPISDSAHSASHPLLPWSISLVTQSLFPFPPHYHYSNLGPLPMTDLSASVSFPSHLSCPHHCQSNLPQHHFPWVIPLPMNPHCVPLAVRSSPFSLALKFKAFIQWFLLSSLRSLFISSLYVLFICVRYYLNSMYYMPTMCLVVSS